MIKLGQSVRFGAWLLIVLNLLMAFGCIWIFTRMAPAIERINYRNARSLDACRRMLAAVADPETLGARSEFDEALAIARNNVTEVDEPAAIQRIEQHYKAAFAGDASERSALVIALLELGESNGAALRSIAGEARQLGVAGAWGVVFMALSLLLAGLVFKRRINRNLVAPFEELSAVIEARRNGDRMRRCSGTDLSRDVAHVFNGINDVLDEAGNTSIFEEDDYQ